MESKTFTIL